MSTRTIVALPGTNGTSSTTCTALALTTSTRTACASALPVDEEDRKQKTENRIRTTGPDLRGPLRSAMYGRRCAVPIAPCLLRRLVCRLLFSVFCFLFSVFLARRSILPPFLE